LRRKLGRLEMQALRGTLLPLAMAGALAGVIAWHGSRFWERSLGHQTVALRTGAVFAPAVAAGVVYLACALALRIPAAREMAGMALKRRRLKAGNEEI